MAEIFTDTLGSVDQRTHHVNRHVVTTCFRTDFIFMDCRLGNTFYFFYTIYLSYFTFYFMYFIYLLFILSYCVFISVEPRTKSEKKRMVQ